MEDHPAEGLAALDVGVRTGRVGQREGAVDHDTQVAAGDRLEVTGDHGVGPGRQEAARPPGSSPTASGCSARMAEMSRCSAGARPASPTVTQRPR